MEGYDLGFRFEQLGGGDMMTFTKKNTGERIICWMGWWAEEDIVDTDGLEVL